MTESLASRSDPRFRSALAIALRSNPDAWRLRRTDQFSPLDLNSARHRVTLQLLITAEFVNEVIRGNDDLERTCETAKEGETLSVYIPVLRMPKRILVDFKSTDVAGHAVPLLPRTHDSLIVAEELVASFGVAAPDARYAPLKTILAALIYLNPVSLLFAVDSFARSNGAPFGHGRPLAAADLEAWMFTEAEYLKENMGWSTLRVMRDAASENPEGPLKIPLRQRQTEVRRDAVGYFPTIAHLICYGVRDVLKCVDEWGPAASAATRNKLVHQMRGTNELVAELYREAELDPPVDPDWELLAKLHDCIYPGLRYLRRISAEDPGRLKSLIDELETWTPFVIADVTLGKPLVLHIEERLPLGDWHPLPGERRKRIRRPHEQYYPIVIRDAPSLHVEIQLDDPELRVPTRRYRDGLIRKHLNRRVRVVGFDPDKGRLGFGGQTDSPTGALFEAEARPSNRLLHFYASLRRNDGRFWDEIENLHLAIPIRLTWQIKLAMYSLCIGLTIAALFTAGEVWPTTVFRDDPLTWRRELVTISALAVTVGVWSVQWQHPTALVARKLRVFRWWIIASLGLIVVTMGAYLAASGYRSLIAEDARAEPRAEDRARDTWWFDGFQRPKP